MPNPIVALTPALTDRDIRELETVVEASVDSARIAWVAAAGALREIRERRLYVYLCGTFEEYVERRFSRTRQWAYQLIESVTTVQQLSTANDPPTVARHVRALNGLTPTAASEAWDSAADGARAENRPVTTIDVEAAVQRVRSGSAARVTSESVRQEQWLAACVRQASRLSVDNRRRLIEQIRNLR